jgi:hypothetical protein
MALSGYSVAVGDPIDFYGGPFLTDPTLGETRCRFQGTFRATVATENVDLEIVPNPEDIGKLRWLRFGPFSVPFAATGNRIGQFVGTVVCTNVYADGQRLESAPLSATIAVEPSIVCTDFQPIGATCPSPARRALDGFAYRLACQAVGFSPAAFTVLFKSDAPEIAPARWQLPAQGGGFTLSDTGGGQLAFPPIPETRDRYIAELTVAATSSDGTRHQVTLPFSVHRPLEVVYGAIPRIAQFYPPEAVSGCLPGGFTGNTVSYSEQTVDQRTRGFATDYSQSWLQAVSSGTSVTRTESNSTTVSTTDGTQFTVKRNTDNGWQGNGSLNVFSLATFGGNRSQTDSDGSDDQRSWSRTVADDRTQSDSVSRMEATTTAVGNAVGNLESKTVSSATAAGQSSSQLIVPGQYGVWYRQRQRWEWRGTIVSYNLCGAPDEVGSMIFTDWKWGTELAQGLQCPPPSTLPKASCEVPPC